MASTQCTEICILDMFKFCDSQKKKNGDEEEFL